MDIKLVREMLNENVQPKEILAESKLPKDLSKVEKPEEEIQMLAEKDESKDLPLYQVKIKVTFPAKDGQAAANAVSKCLSKLPMPQGVLVDWKKVDNDIPFELAEEEPKETKEDTTTDSKE